MLSWFCIYSKRYYIDDRIWRHSHTLMVMSESDVRGMRRETGIETYRHLTDITIFGRRDAGLVFRLC